MSSNNERPNNRCRSSVSHGLGRNRVNSAFLVGCSVVQESEENERLVLDSRKYGFWLWSLSGLFALRVFGQLLQLKLDIPYLPPFEAWHSAVVPYGLLVTSQFVILSSYMWVAHRFSKRYVRPSALAARIWLSIGSVYAVVMIGRLVVGLTGLSPNPWFSNYLPTFFHIVLAAFMLVAGAFHLRYAGMRQQLEN